MEIKENRIKVRQLTENYLNDLEEGVTGYGGQLDIRPPYQREFVYNDKQRDEVIRTIMKGLPLNVMYWVDRGPEMDAEGLPRFEVMDGQQRTVSVCEYVDGAFSVDGMYFGNLPKDTREQILNYPLFVYICQGTESEKLEWFQIINIAGEKLTDQELRNAIYAGPWVTDAKRRFSKTGAPAYQIGSKYLKGSPIRQDYLETAITWDAARTGEKITDYMGARQGWKNAAELWAYFESVIEWVRHTFPHYRAIMKGLPWGLWYNKHHTRADLNPIKLEKRLSELIKDEDVTRKPGVYEYVLTGDEKALSIRAFDNRTKLAVYERQGGICPICGQRFAFEDMAGDHIVPWSKGGHTTPDNCQMLCHKCNQEKKAKYSKPLAK